MSEKTVYSHPFSKSSEIWPQGWPAPFSQSMMPVMPVPPGGINVMAPAFGAAAAMAAIGVGVAACTWGSMLGAMSSAATSGKLPALPGYDSSTLFGFAGNWDESETETGVLSGSGSSPGARAESAARTIAADIESAVMDVEETGRKVAEALSEDIENAVQSTASLTRSKPAGNQNVPASKSNRSKMKSEAGTAPAEVGMKKPAGIERPSAVDDLKMITGIGPKLEMVLNDLGVFTYAQIAAWGAAEIAWIDDYLSFSGRIERDKWIEQASAIANKQSASKNG